MLQRSTLTGDTTMTLTDTLDRILTTAGLFGMLAAVPLAGVLSVIQSLAV